jgi:phosphoribosylformylglycinamidine cyclo-ligase
MAEKDNAQTQHESLTYAGAGVDIAAGNALVEAIKPAAKRTMRPEVIGGLGGFGALFDLKKTGYRDPILVSGTDGVGTKLKIAQAMNKHDTIGIDLVAMCVNDLLVQGAEPLFFLDYFATGALKVEQAASVIQGIAKGCELSGCALIGGETAEMPGMYAPGEYDLAGFAVGAVERHAVLPRMDRLEAGDVILGLASSGVHSNGFSLVRALLERGGIELESALPGEMGKNYPSVGEMLLEPTRLYVKPLLQVLHEMNASPEDSAVKALAHITGGGLTENLPRVFSEGVSAVIDLEAWPLPPLFRWLQTLGAVAEDEMLRTFNCGIGMVLVCAAEAESLVRQRLERAGETVFRLGELVASSGTPTVRYLGSL